jgi:hypothetical protein
MKTVYRFDQVLDMLREAIAQVGSQYQWATKYKLSPQYVSDVLRGRRNMGPAILKALGVEAITQCRSLK